MHRLIEFFDCPFFIVVGGLSTTILIFSFLYKLICWLFSITPIAWRLGRAIYNKKIAIFGDDNAYNEIKSAIADSPAFREKKYRTDKIKCNGKMKALFFIYSGLGLLWR